MMAASALAAVMTSPGKTELRELPLPLIGNDDGLLRVERCGVSEADPISFRRGDLAPAILGHEIVGIIERVGAKAADRWQVEEGDRVIVQEYLPCGECEWCARAEYRLCPQAQIGAPAARRFGLTSADDAPGLWGGFSQYLYLPPQSILHRVPSGMDASIASFALPVANGVQWGALEGRVTPGCSVLIFGCAMAGLAAVCAANEANARAVILCGLSREKDRRAAGKSFGASHVFEADQDGLAERIAAATEGQGADVIVDTTSDTSGRVAASAIKAAATGATLVLGGLGMVPLNLGEIRRKYLTIKPVRGHSAMAVDRALELLQLNASSFGKLPTRSFALAQTDAAIRAGDPEAFPNAFHAEVHPWM